VLQLHAFQWFNRFFKGDSGAVRDLAEPQFEWEQLRVFDTLPTDEINTRVHEVFTQVAAQPETPSSQSSWASQREAWMEALREKCFAGWPAERGKPSELNLEQTFEGTSDGLRLTTYDFDSQHDIRLRLYVLEPTDPAESSARNVLFHPLDERGWNILMGAVQSQFPDQFGDEPKAEVNPRELAGITRIINETGAVAYVAPRGIGPTRTDPKPLEQVHLRRRFMLLGQTLDGMQVWDVRRAMQAIRVIDRLADRPLHLEARRTMAGIALYAALFEPDIESLKLSALPASHRDGPDFLNVLRFLDVPQAAAMVAENCRLEVEADATKGWEFTESVDTRFGWNRFNLVTRPAKGE
jgi:hypothetical protein